MKIAFVSHEGSPIKSGGVTLLNDLINEFQKIDLDVTTYLPKFRNYNDPEISSSRRLNMTRNSEGNISKFELIRFIVVGVLTLRRKLKKDKITHIYSIFAFPSGFLVCLATACLSIKKIVIVDAVDLPDVEYSPMGSSKLLRTIVIHTLKYADKILVIQGLESEFESFCGFDYTPVMAGINLPLQIERPHLDQSEFRIVTIARLVKRKNIALAIDILKDLIDLGIPTRLIIVGDGPEKAALKLLASQLEVERYVDFKGFLNEEQIPNLLSTSHAYLFTGANEGISVALLQALSYGLPAVVTRNQGNSRIFGQIGDSFMVSSRNSQPFAEVLTRIYRDKEYSALAREISLEIAKPFLWQNSIQKFLP